MSFERRVRAFGGTRLAASPSSQKPSFLRDRGYLQPARSYRSLGSLCRTGGTYGASSIYRLCQLSVRHNDNTWYWRPTYVERYRKRNERCCAQCIYRFGVFAKDRHSNIACRTIYNNMAVYFYSYIQIYIGWCDSPIMGLVASHCHMRFLCIAHSDSYSYLRDQRLLLIFVVVFTAASYLVGVSQLKRISLSRVQLQGSPNEEPCLSKAFNCAGAPVSVIPLLLLLIFIVPSNGAKI